MSNEAAIANGEFFGRADLTEYRVPEGVSVIGDDAFGHCENLKQIIIPDGVSRIGHRAFAHCSSLKQVRLPDSVTDIGVLAFAACHSLEDISLPAMEFFHPNIVDGCNSIRHMTIGGRYASDDEAVYTVDGQELCLVLPHHKEWVEIPDGVSRIGPSAFSLCDGLCSLSLPCSTDSVDEEAFDGCRWLEEIKMRPGGLFSSHNGILMSDSVVVRCPQAFKSGRVNIAQGIIAIGARAFKECRNVTEVRLPPTLERIEECAFARSQSLEAVSDGDLTTIGRNAFLGCANLESLPDLDAADSIGAYAFGECKSLEKVRIPDQIHKIEDGLFVDCEKLANVDFHDDVAEIGAQAFLGCKELKSVDLPAGLQRIGYGAFAWSGLQAIALPHQIEDVAPMAFGLCKDLELASGPRHISTSADSAFYGCDKLSTISFS